MVLMVIGVLLLAAKLADFGPTGGWSWWVVGAPFAAAVVWWQFADSSGLTQRRAMEKMDRRKAQRRERALEALGLGTRNGRPAARPRDEARHDPTDTLPPGDDASKRREPRP